MYNLQVPPLSTSLFALAPEDARRNRPKLAPKLQLVLPPPGDRVLAVPRAEQPARNRRVRVRVLSNPHHVDQHVLEAARVQQRRHGHRQRLEHVAAAVARHRGRRRAKLRQPPQAQLRAELQRAQHGCLLAVVLLRLRPLELPAQMDPRVDGGRGRAAEDQLGDDGVVHGAGDGAQRVVVRDPADAHTLRHEPLRVPRAEEARREAPHQAAVAGAPGSGARPVRVERLGEAREAVLGRGAHVDGPRAGLAAGPVAAAPLEKVPARARRHVVLLVMLAGEAVEVREEHAARHVRVVGGVARGPLEDAAAGNVAEAVVAVAAGRVGGLDEAVALELDGGAERVAGVEAEQRADNAGLTGHGRHFFLIQVVGWNLV